MNLGINAVLDAVFYRFGIWGIPLSTSLVNIAGTIALVVLFRRRVEGFEIRGTMETFGLVTVASAVLAAVAWWVWHLLDSAFGQSLPAQIVSLGAALVVGYAVFFGVCRLLGVRELETDPTSVTMRQLTFEEEQAALAASRLKNVDFSYEGAMRAVVAADGKPITWENDQKEQFFRGLSAQVRDLVVQGFQSISIPRSSQAADFLASETVETTS